MAVRKVVRIDEEKCNGCGLCVPNCAEGALAVVDGKARLVGDSYCDGLGACLGECPQGAITVQQREAEAFDPEAVAARLAAESRPHQAATHGAPQRAAPAEPCAGGCPGARVTQLAGRTPAASDHGAQGDSGTAGGQDRAASGGRSRLGHWPVQLALVPVEAPFYQDAELVLAADCAAFTMGDFHERLLEGRALAITCPKLDDLEPYVAKLAEILRRNAIRGLVLVHMEVPCCGGIVHLARQAAALSGRRIPARDVTIGIGGDVLRDELTILGD